MWGRPINWSRARIWALVVGGADEPEAIWCGTLPGGRSARPTTARAADAARAVGTSQAQQWMGAAPICLASIRFASIRAIPAAVACGITGGIWFTRIPARVGRTRQGNARRICSAGADA